MKTAEEFVTDWLDKQPAHIKIQFTHLSNEADKALFEAAIEFAKLHVQAALKEAAEEVSNEQSDERGIPYISDRLIIGAYPLSNIN